MTTETRDHHGKSFAFDWQNAVNNVPPRPGMYWAKQLSPNGKTAEIRLIKWGVGDVRSWLASTESGNRGLCLRRSGNSNGLGGSDE